MIEKAGITPQSAIEPLSPGKPGGKVLKMVKNERMGGYVPAWVPADSAKDTVAQNLAQAGKQQNTASFETALISQDTPPDPAGSNSNEFGFADLLDMINPLQHIPVVGSIYREITGDEIKPIGKLVGGAVFGGPIGAGAALVNVVVKEETGRDVTGNAIALAMNDFKAPAKIKPQAHPETRLNEAVQIAKAPGNDLPGALLSFTDLGHNEGFHVEKVKAAGGRTAGSFTRRVPEEYSAASNGLAAALPPREPITQISMKRIPTAHYNN